ncbi:MAG TPA: sigma-70 family RNA polymerase sigma factor [Chryseosolibacter sp.]|nr:sigma-70 family RNA polymerase sigma factor [Chryseosolibacter sp.]
MDFKIFRAREDDLIKGCREGDQHAQQQLFDRYSSKMYGICSRYVKNTMQAEDILVMAFTKVFERISQFKGEGSFEGWLRRITVNEALTYLRRSRAMMVVETDLDKADLQPDYDHLSDHLEAEDLLKMIDKLPPGYRIVFNMYAIDGYSHKEIAGQLGISENTSKSQLSRARHFLQKLLAETDWQANTKMQQP